MLGRSGYDVTKSKINIAAEISLTAAAAYVKRVDVWLI
jgi:hypothetical protein